MNPCRNIVAQPRDGYKIAIAESCLPEPCLRKFYDAHVVITHKLSQGLYPCDWRGCNPRQNKICTITSAHDLTKQTGAL